jgi:hypothetical protein
MARRRKTQQKKVPDRRSAAKRPMRAATALKVSEPPENGQVSPEPSELDSILDCLLQAHLTLTQFRTKP